VWRELLRSIERKPARDVAGERPGRREELQYTHRHRPEIEQVIVKAPDVEASTLRLSHAIAQLVNLPGADFYGSACPGMSAEYRTVSASIWTSDSSVQFTALFQQGVGTRRGRSVQPATLTHNRPLVLRNACGSHQRPGLREIAPGLSLCQDGVLRRQD